MDFRHQVAVVTGGGSGIGRATAAALATRGAVVVVADRQVQAAERCADAIAAAGGEAMAVGVDVADAQSVAAMMQAAAGRVGGVDILVTCAGIFRDARVEQLSDADWEQVLDVNLKGTFNCIRAAVPGMKERRRGRIVTVASVCYKGNFGQANYAASKGGVVSLTRTVALEVAPWGVTANCVVPGFFATPLLAAMKETVRDRMAAKIPLGRIGRPEELANTILFLASDLAGYITGAVLDVDGGLSAGLPVR